MVNDLSHNLIWVNLVVFSVNPSFPISPNSPTFSQQSITYPLPQLFPCLNHASILKQFCNFANKLELI